MNAPVFFDEKISAAIAGKSNDEALTIIAALIDEARDAKLAGYGPPQDDIVKAMRRYHQIYEAWVAERLPSTAKETARC